MEREVVYVGRSASDHRPEHVICSGAMTEGEETGGSDIFGNEPKVVDDGEQRLACVVDEHEFAGGGGAAPRPADSTASENVFRWKPQEDLFDEDEVGQIV